MGKWSSWDSVPLAECDRCKQTHAHRDLMKDVNKPGLLVCEPCRDDLNPFVAIARHKFNIAEEVMVRNPRPMAPIGYNDLNILTEDGYHTYMEYEPGHAEGEELYSSPEGAGETPVSGDN